MTTGVYAIINAETGMAYIGSSIRIQERWVNHRSTLRLGIGPSPAMVTDWQRMGAEGFMFTILEVVPADDAALNHAEQRWLDYYQGRLYNKWKRPKRSRRLKQQRSPAEGLAHALAQAERARAADDLDGAERWERIAADIATRIAERVD